MIKKRSDLVSVIIPCYNGARWVGEAIESVLAQTYRELEIIVVDDGSTDESAEVIKLFRDGRIRYIHQENRGLSAARNTGIAAAEGAYISFLDADDIYFPDKTRRQVAFLRGHPHADVVTGDYTRTDKNLRTLYRHHPLPGMWPRKMLLIGGLFPVHCWLARREVLDEAGGFDEELWAAEDWDLICRIALLNKVIIHENTLACAYRMTPGSMTMKPRRQTEATLRVVEKTFDSHNMPIPLAGLKEEALAHSYLYGARRAFIVHDAGALQEYLDKAREAHESARRRSRGELLHYFVYTTRGMEAEEFRWRLETLLDALPDDKADYPAERRVGWFHHRREQALAAADARRRVELAVRGAGLAALHPVQAAGVVFRRRNGHWA